MPETKFTTCTVYGLASSRDGELRYVGQTSQPLKVRLYSHIGKAKSGLKGYLSSWILSVLSAGFKVEIFSIRPDAERNAEEIRLIALYRNVGARLVNMTDGGEGSLGKKRGPMSEEMKARISATKKGTKLSAEHRAAIGAAHKNRVFSNEHRASISAAKMGHKVSDETRKKLSEALKGRKHA